MELPKSKYKGVYPVIQNGKTLYWRATFTYKGRRQEKVNLNERKSAICYDKMLIEIGKEPVNILTRKI